MGLPLAAAGGAAVLGMSSPGPKAQSFQDEFSQKLHADTHGETGSDPLLNSYWSDDSPIVLGRVLVKDSSGKPQWGSMMHNIFSLSGTIVAADVSIGTVSANVLSQTLNAVSGAAMKALPPCIFEFEWTGFGAGANGTITLTLKASTGNPPGAPVQRSEVWKHSSSNLNLPETRAFIINPRNIGDRAFWTALVSDPNQLRVDVDAIVNQGTCIVRQRNLMWYNAYRAV